MNYLMKLLSEPSTWAGIIKIATSAGLLNVNNDQTTQIIAFMLALVGLINVFWQRDNKQVIVVTNNPTEGK